MERAGALAGIRARSRRRGLTVPAIRTYYRERL